MQLNLLLIMQESGMINSVKFITLALLKYSIDSFFYIICGENSLHDCMILNA